MGDTAIETLIAKRAKAMELAYTSCDVDKVMVFFSQDVDFTDVGTSPSLRTVKAFTETS